MYEYLEYVQYRTREVYTDKALIGPPLPLLFPAHTLEDHTTSTFRTLTPVTNVSSWW